MSQIIIPLVTALAVFMNEPLASAPKQPNYLRNRLLSLKAGVVAFRAGSLEAPENSAQAVQQALSLGVTGVHIDVRKTLDGHFVLSAEDDLTRVTGHSVLVSQTLLEDLPLLQQNIVSEYGETFQSQQSGQKAVEPVHVATLEEVLEQFVENDAVIILQDHTAEFKDTKQIVLAARAKGLLSRLVLQTEQSRWSKLRALSDLPLNLMEASSSLEQRFEEFVKGEYQQLTQALETDLFNTTFDFKTIRESPLEVREAPLSVASKDAGSFNWPSEEVTLEQFGQTMQEYKAYVQLMNFTYQQKSRLPVSYFMVNHAEDLELARELGANLVFTEKPAELLVEKLSQENVVQRQQWNLQR